MLCILLPARVSVSRSQGAIRGKHVARNIRRHFPTRYDTLRVRRTTTRHPPASPLHPHSNRIRRASRPLSSKGRRTRERRASALDLSERRKEHFQLQKPRGSSKMELDAFGVRAVLRRVRERRPSCGREIRARGPAGGRTGGRAGGRMDRRTGGRMDRRAGGRYG